MQLYSFIRMYIQLCIYFVFFNRKRVSENYLYDSKRYKEKIKSVKQLTTPLPTAFYVMEWAIFPLLSIYL